MRTESAAVEALRRADQLERSGRGQEALQSLIEAASGDPRRFPAIERAHESAPHLAARTVAALRARVWNQLQHELRDLPPAHGGLKIALLAAVIAAGGATTAIALLSPDHLPGTGDDRALFFMGLSGVLALFAFTRLVNAVLANRRRRRRSETGVLGIVHVNACRLVEHTRTDPSTKKRIVTYSQDLDVVLQQAGRRWPMTLSLPRAESVEIGSYPCIFDDDDRSNCMIKLDPLSILCVT